MSAFSLPLSFYQEKSVLAIGLDESAIVKLAKEAAFCTVLDYSEEVITSLKKLATKCHLAAIKADIRMPLPDLQKDYDLIITKLIPAEEAPKWRLLSRLKPLLKDGGQLIINRPELTQTFSKEELPTAAHDSYFILTSTLHPLPPPPREARLIINHLSDPYPMKERFLRLIIENLVQIESLVLTWNITTNNSHIVLSAQGDYDIEMTLDLEHKTFSATINQPRGNVFHTLANLATITFCRDVQEHHISTENGLLAVEVTAC